MDTFKLDKTAFSVTDMNDTQSDKEYWLSKTPEERLQALEYLRRQVHGDDYAKSGFQRILEVVKQA